MYLTNEEEHALNGEYGEALATAYRILVAIGEATEAERLIKIEWAHVSGVNYNTIGDAGLAFLEEMSREKVRVKTSINPMGFDPNKIDPKIDDEFKDKQMRIINAYKNMNADLTLTCIPYEVLDMPRVGSYVSLAESNAAVYANSLLDLRTNKESALSALASAITGKAPYSLLRIEEFRNPDTRIVIKKELKNELDYGLLGYFAGKNAKNVVSIPIKIDERWKAKAISAGLGTSSSCGMFSNKDYGEEIIYDVKEEEDIIGELSDSYDYNTIVFGSPQLGFDDLQRLASKLKDKKFKKRCIIFCARKAYEDALKHNIAARLERSGAELYSDCCACLTPLIDKGEGIVTNSIKGAYYLKTWNRAKVTLKSMDEIIESDCCDY